MQKNKKYFKEGNYPIKWFLSSRKEQNSWVYTYQLCIQIANWSEHFLLNISLLEEFKFPNNYVITQKMGKYIWMNSFTLV